MIETGNIVRTRACYGTGVPTITSQAVPEAFWLTNPRTVHVVGDVAYVPLTQGAVALIDAADLWRVEGSNWYLHRSANRLYAALSLEHEGGRSIVYMHQVIAAVGVGDGEPRQGQPAEVTMPEKVRNRLVFTVFSLDARPERHRLHG